MGALQHPFTCLVAGPTGCGKTSWVRKLLEQRDYTLSEVPQRVVWAYGVWQNEYNEMTHLVDRWIDGVPKMSDFDPNVTNLVIIDDLMTECDESVTQMFTKGYFL